MKTRPDQTPKNSLSKALVGVVVVGVLEVAGVRIGHKQNGTNEGSYDAVHLDSWKRPGKLWSQRGEEK